VDLHIARGAVSISVRAIAVGMVRGGECRTNGQEQRKAKQGRTGRREWHSEEASGVSVVARRVRSGHAGRIAPSRRKGHDEVVLPAYRVRPTYGGKTTEWGLMQYPGGTNGFATFANDSAPSPSLTME
jgi:hypothetical protein